LKELVDTLQLIWLGTRQQLNKLSTQVLTLPNAKVQFSTAVKNLGVELDSHLTLANHAGFARLGLRHRANYFCRVFLRPTI